MTEAGNMNTDDHFEEQPEDNSLSRTNEFRPKEFSAFIGGFSDEQFKGIQKSIASVVAPSTNSITQNCISESTLRSITSTVAPSINSVAQKYLSLFPSVLDSSAILRDLLSNIDFSFFEFSSETQEKISEAQQYICRDAEKKARRSISSDFVNNPDACKRFVEWFETSSSTKGENGKATYKKLAILVGVDRKTATKFVKAPERITVLFATRLCTAIGKEAYYDIVYGEEGRKKIIAEQEKERKIEQLVSVLEGLKPEQAIEAIDRIFGFWSIGKQAEIPNS